MLERPSYSMLLKQISDEAQKNANNYLRSQGLTLAQVGALLELYHAPERRLSMKELEKRLHVAQSTTAGIISRLEQKGLAEGFGDSEDKRIKLVRITQSGIENVLDGEKDALRTEEQLLSGLTEAERSIFYTLLKKVRDTLQ